MTITSKTVYTTTDGKTFDSLCKAQKHEDETVNQVERDFIRYTTTTYAGQKLLVEHSLTEYGIWEVRGEDPNCDFGGHHHEPKIGKVEGTLENAIRWAVAQSGFWQWGAGGSIKRKDNEKIIKV